MLKKQLIVIAALTTASVLPLAQADQLEDNRWYVSPFGTYLNSENRPNSTDSNWGAGMGFGKMLDKHFNVEVRGFYQEFDLENRSHDAEIAGGTVDLQYYFFRDTFSPYVVGAIGGINTQFNGTNTSFSNKKGSFDKGSFIFETGLGATYELHDNFLLRADARYRLDTLAGDIDSDGDVFNDMTVNVGFVVPFGPKPTEAKYEAPAPVPAPVADCSTLDSDSDGVNNCDDRCDGTMSGSKVDAQGCPLSLELKGVNFGYDSAELTFDAMAILDTIAANLIAYPDKHDIEVHGHTSSEGSNSHNMKLSQRRSQSVVDYLTMKGVTNRLYARGYGESQPIADNTTEEGRAQNRRVELVWTGY
ncbi:MAG: OmpA family protein [Methylococcaceae bacterium]